MKPSYASYTMCSTYESCPKKYKFRYVDKTKIPFDKRKALFGIIIGRIFEKFYDDRIWSESDPLVSLLGIIDQTSQEMFDKEKFDPNSDLNFVKELKEDLNKYVPTSLNNIKRYDLVTLNSHAEIDLTVDYAKENLRLAGRTDFIHYKDDGQIWILDGKGSKYREKYVDFNQLVWYALQHSIKFGKAPNRLGFFYYKFPKEPLTWIQYSKNDLVNCLTKTKEIVRKIQLSVYNPNPGDRCHNCDYKDVCDEGKEFLSVKKKEEKRVTSSIFDLEEV